MFYEGNDSRLIAFEMYEQESAATESRRNVIGRIPAPRHGSAALPADPRIQPVKACGLEPATRAALAAGELSGLSYRRKLTILAPAVFGRGDRVDDRGDDTAALHGKRGSCA